MAAVISSPHLHSPNSVTRIMGTVLLALVPGIAAATWAFGWAIPVKLLLAVGFALLFETAILLLRRKPLKLFLTDLSAVLTAVLLAMAMPQLSPWWLIAVGVFFAIVVAKHLYGGLGYNPFNPAMVGFVVLLISFPVDMTSWIPPTTLAHYPLDLGATLQAVFLEHYPDNLTLDALTMATPLDTMKTQLSLSKTVSEIVLEPIFGIVGGVGWEWMYFAYLCGGLFLVWRGIIGWQIPTGIIGAITLLSLIWYLYDPSNYPSPWFHLFNGATMLGAFFIATDPVTASTTPRGRLVFGIGIGTLTFVIRTWGGFPDGIAFAVLLMNLTAPTIDYYTQPRVFGQDSKPS